MSKMTYPTESLRCEVQGAPSPETAAGQKRKADDDDDSKNSPISPKEFAYYNVDISKVEFSTQPTTPPACLPAPRIPGPLALTPTEYSSACPRRSHIEHQVLP